MNLRPFSDFYLPENTATANIPKANATSIVNNVLSTSSSTGSNTSDNKDNLKLYGTSLEGMDLWNVILEYFSKYAFSNTTKEALTEIENRQKSILRLIDKVSEEFIIQYRSASQTNIISGPSKKTTNDYIYRYISTIYRHYFYFVALYNLRFVEYLNSLVDKGSFFNKNFILNLDTLYDPPQMKYYKDGYLNPNSVSEFNNNVLDLTDWYEELDSKTKFITTGFPKATDWDFEALMAIYDIGLAVHRSNPPLTIPISTNPKLIPYFTKINNYIRNIIDRITTNINELKPNLINKSTRSATSSAVEIDANKNKIKNQTKPISNQYDTTDEFANMNSNFRGLDRHDQYANAAKNISKYTKQGNIKKKDK